MKRIALLLALAAPAIGCTQTGIICTSDEARCGQTCANLEVNPDHCGACGISCPTGFVCTNGACGCPSGFTTCGQSCVDLKSAVNDCGSCGNICPAGTFCVDGGCGKACPSGSVVCNGDCVDVSTDRQQCGGCADAGGAVCAQGQACHDGACVPDLYAACFNSGSVFALDGQGETVSPTKAIAPPTNPAGLAFTGATQLDVVDGIAAQLYGFDVADGGFGTPSTFAVGQGPNAVAASADLVAVPNAQDNSLDLLRASDAGWTRLCPRDAGSCTASVQFAANSSPLYAAFGSDSVYVSLQGNTDVSTPTGNQLARVSLSDLSVQLTDLSTLILQSDGGTVARPNGVAVSDGHVYVALANLNGFTASGPGLVEVLDIPTDGGATLPHGQPVALGQGCLNAGAVLLAGSKLYVACGPKYDPSTFAVVVPGALGALDLSHDPPVPLFAPVSLACAADAGSCMPGAPSRMAIADGKLYVGDNSDGRLFVADPTTGAVSQGPANPLLLCPAPDGGFDFISDLAARP